VVRSQPVQEEAQQRPHDDANCLAKEECRTSRATVPPTLRGASLYTESFKSDKERARARERERECMCVREREGEKEKEG